METLRSFGSTDNTIVIGKTLSVAAIGIFSGTALGFNTFILPSLQKFSAASSLSVWNAMFHRAGASQVSMIAISTLSSAFVYYKTKNAYFLYGAAIMASIVPYTLGLLGSINNELIEAHKAGTAGPRTESLLARWEKINLGRAVLSLTALGLVAYGGATSTPIKFHFKF
ncbi:hypothetical protein BGW42_004819 [Actinomortierella wolfii]|nr:hypothetical protein BGW42_004819 [Actinomortierella wolfii]KAG0227063.1 hypothetical protein BGW41_003985 [Actinomortierella wolfii]